MIQTEVYTHFLKIVYLNSEKFLKHSRYKFVKYYEKHALRVSQVIAAVAKVSCKHGLWLVARVNKNMGGVDYVHRLFSEKRE